MIYRQRGGHSRRHIGFDAPTRVPDADRVGLSEPAAGAGAVGEEGALGIQVADEACVVMLAVVIVDGPHARLGLAIRCGHQVAGNWARGTLFGVGLRLCQGGSPGRGGDDGAVRGPPRGAGRQRGPRRGFGVGGLGRRGDGVLQVLAPFLEGSSVTSYHFPAMPSRRAGKRHRRSAVGRRRKGRGLRLVGSPSPQAGSSVPNDMVRYAIIWRVR